MEITEEEIEVAKVYFLAETLVKHCDRKITEIKKQQRENPIWLIKNFFRFSSTV